MAKKRSKSRGKPGKAARPGQTPAKPVASPAAPTTRAVGESAARAGKGRRPAATSKPGPSKPATAKPGPSKPANRQQAPAPWWDRWASALLALALFVLYAATTATGPVTGDNPEFVAAAYEQGVPHSPGYPLTTLIGHLFSTLPLGGTTYSINLAAAVAAAATAGLVCQTARLLQAPLWAALLGTALFGSNALVWEFALQLEAFAFLNLTTAGVVFCLVSWKLDPRRLSWLLWAAAVFGLGMVSHQNTSLLVPGICYLVWTERRIVLRRRVIIGQALALSLVCWLLPYGYTLWAASRDPVVNWGGVSGIGGVWDVIWRKGYGDVRFGFGRVGSSPERIGYLLKSFGFVGLIPAWGLWRQWSQRRWYAGFTAIGIAVIVLVMILLSGEIATYGYFVLSRFFIMWHVVAGPCYALGLVGLAEVVRRLVTASWQAWLVPVAAAVLALALVVTTAPAVNQRGRVVTQNYAEDILASVPRDGVLLVSGDEAVLPVLEAQVVRGIRRDVRVILTPLLATPWYVDQLRARYPDLHFPSETFGRGAGSLLEFFQANPGVDFRVRGATDISGYRDRSIQGVFYWTSAGLVDRLVPYGQDVAISDLAAQLDQQYATYDIPDAADVRGPDTSFEPGILQAYAAPWVLLGDYWAKAPDPQQARAAYEKALDINPDQPKLTEKLAQLAP